jgi:tetratricopeptide (TPR) repeat protein
MPRIKRNYSRSLFRKNRSRTQYYLGLLTGVMLAVGGLLLVVSWRFDQLQLVALDMIDMAPTATPHAHVRAQTGAVLYQEGDLRGALNAFGQAMQQEPEDVAYLYEYGRLLVENEQYDEALEMAERAIAEAPADPRGYALKARGLMWEDPEQAVITSLTGLEYGEYAPIYAAMGVAYTNMGRWQEGLRFGGRALELDDTDPFVHIAYSWPLTYVGRYQESIDRLEQAIAINPNQVNPYFELAAKYRIQAINQPQNALAVYFHILDMDPDNAKANLRICQTYASIEEADFSVAEPYCRQALNINPDYAEAYKELGRMQYTRRNYEGSINSFNECVDLGGNFIECWYLRGLAHYILGQCDDAWTLLQEAQQMGIEQNVGQGAMDQIEIGLFNIRENCVGYGDVAVPTPIPPTPLPPTPIGGFG